MKIIKLLLLRVNLSLERSRLQVEFSKTKMNANKSYIGKMVHNINTDHTDIESRSLAEVNHIPAINSIHLCLLDLNHLCKVFPVYNCTVFNHCFCTGEQLMHVSLCMHAK